MTRRHRRGRDVKASGEVDPEVEFEAEHIDAIFIEPPKKCCPPKCLVKCFEQSMDPEMSEDRWLLPSRIFAVFLAFCQVGIGLGSILTAQPFDGQDKTEVLKVDQGVGGMGGATSNITSDCPASDIFRAGPLYGEPSLMFFAFGVIALVSLIAGPYGVYCWNYVFGLPIVAFFYTSFPRWEELCPHEDIPRMYAVTISQSVVSGICWCSFLLFCVASLVFDCWWTLRAEEADDEETEVPNLTIAV